MFLLLISGLEQKHLMHVRRFKITLCVCVQIMFAYTDRYAQNTKKKCIQNVKHN